MSAEGRPDTERLRGILAPLCVVLLRGSSFTVTKPVLDKAGPFTVTVARFVIGLAALLPFAYR